MDLIRLHRRSLIRAALAAPLALTSWAASAKQMVSPATDFGGVGYYADDNARLLASKARVDVVFMGDSITEFWLDKQPAFFRRGRIDRGISGQTTSQMLLRMMSDVVALRPRALHIMGGTNDIAGNTGPMTPQMSEDNIRAMTDIAQRHGMKVMIASIPPAASFPWAPKIETRRAIASLNNRLERVARQAGATWVDYYRALDDGTAAMKPGLADDGVHPNQAGYAAMAKVIEPVLAKVLRR
jgi:lysophospholipase L1-like esterase